jgi:putative two-component system response regulator
MILSGELFTVTPDGDWNNKHETNKKYSMRSEDTKNPSESVINCHLFPGEQQLCTAKILLIDDEVAHVRALEWGLRKAKFSNFRSLTESTRAREEFDDFQPDIVLLDLNMPELDGFEVLKQLRKNRSADEFLPILVLTGENTTEMRKSALAAGANDFLAKPIDHTEVMLRIRNLLQTRFLHQKLQEISTRLEVRSTQNSVGK